MVNVPVVDTGFLKGFANKRDLDLLPNHYLKLLQEKGAIIFTKMRSEVGIACCSIPREKTELKTSKRYENGRQ